MVFKSQGLDSLGGDYMWVVGGAGDVRKLERACRQTRHCLGFNTNGLLKHSLLRPHSWSRWTDQVSSGLYVLDLDYCQLHQHRCPAHSHCHRFSPGNYDCKCISPWTMTSEHTCQRNALREDGAEPHLGVELEPVVVGGVMSGDIHIIVSTDATDFLGVATLLNSVHANIAPSSAQLLKVHVVLANTTREAFLQYLHCFPSFPHHLPLDIVELDISLLEGRIHVYSPYGNVGNLKSLGNFARFFFHELFPGLSKVLYLDADTVVQGDVTELWRQLLDCDKLLLATPRWVDLQASTHASTSVSSLCGSPALRATLCMDSTSLPR